MKAHKLFLVDRLPGDFDLVTSYRVPSGLGEIGYSAVAELRFGRYSYIWRPRSTAATRPAQRIANMFVVANGGRGKRALLERLRPGDVLQVLVYREGIQGEEGLDIAKRLWGHLLSLGQTVLNERMVR